MNKRFFLLALAPLLALSLVTACGGDDDDVADPQTTATEAVESTATSEGAESPDLAFYQGMIPHHEQAVAMARLVEARTDRPELLELASAIIETQDAEIAEMRAYAQDFYGVDLTAGEADGMEGMEGMEPSAQMAELEALSGEEFDIRFTEMMIEHHRSAVAMAEEVVGTAENPETIDLAQRIITAQEAEIAEMQQWLESWRS